MNSHEGLAEVARNAGFLVSEGQIHRAVTQRLIPRPALILAKQGELAVDGRPTTRGAMDDFLAWCRLRRHLTLLHPLRTLLWMEGCAIPTSDLRTSLASWLPPAPAIELTEEQRDLLSSMALRRAKEARRHLGPYGLSEMDAADATEHVVLRAIGDDPEVGPELRAILAKAMGLERASSDSLGGVRPWYSGDSSPEQLLAGFSFAEMRALVESASDDDLEWARPRARFLVWDLPEFVRLVEMHAGKGFAGLHAAAQLGPASAPLGVIVALRARSFGVGDNIDLISAAVSDALGGRRATSSQAGIAV